MTGLMILSKRYCVYDSPDHHISLIRTLLSPARNLQAVPVPQVSSGILIKTNTRETHKHREREAGAHFIFLQGWTLASLVRERQRRDPRAHGQVAHHIRASLHEFRELLFFPTKHFQIQSSGVLTCGTSTPRCTFPSSNNTVTRSNDDQFQFHQRCLLVVPIFSSV